MAEHSSLQAALPDQLHILFTSTLHAHTLSTWEVKGEAERYEDNISSQTSSVRGPYQGRRVTETIEDSAVHPDSTGETVQGSAHSSSFTADGGLTEEAEKQWTKNNRPIAPSLLSATATTNGELPVAARLACLADYEEHCRRTMSTSAWLYFSGGSMTGATMQRNKDAFKNILITPRALVNVSHLDLTYTIRATGETVLLPIGIAPTSFRSWATPNGELATVGAAQEAGVVCVSSIHADTKLEEIAEAEPGAIRWQQFMLFKDRSITEDLVRRAEKAGVTAVVLTIDKHTSGVSWDRMRGLTYFPPNLMIANLSEPVQTWMQRPHGNPELTWDDVKWFCGLTSLPVIIKGVMSSETARMAVQVGANGIIVSNHGGRALDSQPATMEVLRDVVEAVGEQVEVFVDGGIMTGLDVFKALAYGARMVFIGRSAIWGLAHGGQAGLGHVINILKEELLNVMKLAGTPTLKDVTMERIYKSRQ